MGRSRWALWLVSALLLCIFEAGCSSVEAPPRPDVGWYTRVLGGPANVALVVRMKDMLTDPYYGPMVREAFARRAHGPNDATAAAAQAEELDVVASVSPATSSQNAAAVGVIYAPPAVDPASLVDDHGQRYFDAPRTLPSGVLEYPSHPSQDAGVLFAERGAWILAHGDTVARVRAAVSDSPAPPARLDLEPDALLAVDIQASALEEPDLKKVKLSDSTRRVFDSMEEGVFAVGHGPSGDFVGRVWFTSDEGAKELESKMRDAMKPGADCDATCLLARALLLSLVDMRRDGRRVSVRVHVPELVMRGLAEKAPEK